MVRASSSTVSPTVFSPSDTALSASASPILLAFAASAMAWAALMNASFFATKSVSALRLIRALPEAATRPEDASRSAARAAALAAPLTRSSSTALSKSPSVSSSAFLQSIIPAWVSSRSFFTSAAV